MRICDVASDVHAAVCRSSRMVKVHAGLLLVLLVAWVDFGMSSARVTLMKYAGAGACMRLCACMCRHALKT